MQNHLVQEDLDCKKGYACRYVVHDIISDTSQDILSMSEGFPVTSIFYSIHIIEMLAYHILFQISKQHKTSTQPPSVSETKVVFVCRFIHEKKLRV